MDDVVQIDDIVEKPTVDKTLKEKGLLEPSEELEVKKSEKKLRNWATQI